MVREFIKLTCPGCRREVSAYVPHMGDGSAVRTVKHATEGLERGVLCSFSETLVIRRSNGEWVRG